jgi:aspartyl-tRNA(Asn)/glutamyl-tRNA(Gln) amidotransferase subunit C
MPLTLEEIKHIADLARLDLTDQELSRYRAQLSAILDYFQEIQAIDTEEIPPTTSGHQPSSALREDQPSPGLELQELLRNAPDVQDKQFRVPPIFD